MRGSGRKRGGQGNRSWFQSEKVTILFPCPQLTSRKPATDLNFCAVSLPYL